MQTQKEKLFSTQNMVLIAIFTALIVVCSWIRVPVQPVPFTLQTFAVFVTAGLLGSKRGTISVIVYILLGIIGVPVFAGQVKSGPSVIAGPTGGYRVGFIFLALISGFFAEKFSDNVIMTAIGMVLGTAVTYAFGTIWLCAQMHLTFVQGLYAGVIPYLPGDAAKIVVAIIVGSAVKKAVVKARVLPE